MLTSYICELLYSHNCVIIPGFGGFIATPVPAEFHAKSQMLYPPYKRIAFNASLRNNDGLLTNHIALINGVSYNEAQQYVEKTVSLWLEQLQNTQQLDLSKLGIFSNNNGNWIFKPDTSVNYLQEAYGLAPIHLSPINKEKYKNKVEQQKENRPPMQHQGKINKEKLYRNIAIAMPIVTLLLWAALNPTTINNLCTAGLGFFSKKTPDEVPVKAPEIKTANANIDTAVVDASTAYSEKRFYIVAGCFQDYENAKRLVIALRKKGYPATLAGKRKGMTVVSYMNLPDRHEALKELHKVQSVDPYVWVMRR